MLPVWLKRKLPKAKYSREMAKILADLRLNTVCQSAWCPNRGECFSQGTATFMVLGNICTRSCKFCAVAKGQPWPPDPEEPKRLAQAVKLLGLSYVVVTSVTRDDLEDGGASFFAESIREIRKAVPQAMVEVLTPDFKGCRQALELVLEARPVVFNHNLETVPRLYPRVRPQADYQSSLTLLKWAKEISPDIYTKSGLMVGLGERQDEVVEVMSDLQAVGCDFLTIGQYLRPTKYHLEVKEYVTLEVFEEYKEIGKSLGFLAVSSGPFMRSSYQAKEIFEETRWG